MGFERFLSIWRIFGKWLMIFIGKFAQNLSKNVAKLAILAKIGAIVKLIWENWQQKGRNVVRVGGLFAKLYISLHKHAQSLRNILLPYIQRKT